MYMITKFKNILMVLFDKCYFGYSPAMGAPKKLAMPFINERSPRALVNRSRPTASTRNTVVSGTIGPVHDKRILKRNVLSTNLRAAVKCHHIKS